MEASSYNEQEFPAKNVKGVLPPLDLSFKLVSVPEILQWIADNCSSLKYVVKTVCCPQKISGCEWGKEFTTEWEEYLQELGNFLFLMLLSHLNCSCLVGSSQGVLLWTVLKGVQVAVSRTSPSSRCHFHSPRGMLQPLLHFSQITDESREDLRTEPCCLIFSGACWNEKLILVCFALDSTSLLD